MPLVNSTRFIVEQLCLYFLCLLTEHYPVNEFLEVFVMKNQIYGVTLLLLNLDSRYLDKFGVSIISLWHSAYTEDGFSFKSGFKKIVLSHKFLLVLPQSQHGKS